MIRAYQVVIAILAALLIAALGLIAYGYPLASYVLVRPGDEALVERGRREDATATSATARDDSRYPIVMRLTGRTCVELRSRAADGAGNYLACYENGTGHKIEERSGTGF